eukprot:scaffold32619_cov24-Attheya_sp.AAC.1
MTATSSSMGGIPPPPPPRVGGGMGLSDAQARRLLSEDANHEGDQFRWRRKRGRDDSGGGNGGEEAQAQMAAAADERNTSLFLYGLHKDVSGTLNANMSTTIFDTFRPY